MMKLLLLALCVADSLGDFASYVGDFNKTYDNVEDRYLHQQVFEANLKIIDSHNAEYESGMHTWFMAINHLTDRTPAEFGRLRSTYLPRPGHTHHVDLNSTATPSSPNPTEIDWRTKGAVTKVKNQGGCGSCWAFSATETVESHYQIASASGKLLELAPQTYVNCVLNPDSCGGTGGCEGATMELAFNLTAEKGIALESDMPYKGRDESCTPYTPAVKATGYTKNPTNDAEAFETAVATKGPMSITVAASSWQMYGGGIFSGCSSGLFGNNVLDHGVQAVGYTQDYWIVRNSWGVGWGEKGYIRLTRASDAKTFKDKKPADGVACKPLPDSQMVGGECGMLFDTSYPVGVTAATVLM